MTRPARHAHRVAASAGRGEAAQVRVATDARRLQHGFTLLEVLVATAILGVAVVALLGLHARNLGLAAETGDITVAGTLAPLVLNEARLDPALEDGAARGSFTADPSRAEDGAAARTLYGGPLSERFAWTREVLPTALPGLRQVRVRVTLAGEERSLAELWSALRTPTR